MKWFSISSILSTLLILLGSTEWVVSQWCNRTVMIDKERQVTVQTTVQKRKETFWCRITNYRGDCTYNAVEYKNVTEIYQEPKVIIECCQGYNQIGPDCQPICSNGCENGKCTEPEFCECDEGFQKDVNDTVCQSICQDCPVGSHCVASQCVCLPGFVTEYRNPEDPMVCRPFCNPQCENGTCVGLQCGDCKPYLVKINDSLTGKSWEGDCVKCDCLNGDCKLDYCVCHEGYVKSGPRSCHPECPEYCKEGCAVPWICWNSHESTNPTWATDGPELHETTTTKPGPIASGSELSQLLATVDELIKLLPQLFAQNKDVLKQTIQHLVC